MDWVVLVVFLFVYLGMILGKIPGLSLDRTGVALLGALILVGTGRLSPAEAWTSMDVPTMGLLFGLMVVSAQFRLGGFYTRFTQRLADQPVQPPVLLALVIVATSVLSALLCNDIICLAMSPVLAEGCARRKLNPIPFLLALACASNVGSAATLIGNPQNMLIGQVLKLQFGSYLLLAAVPTLLSLAVVWGILVWHTNGRWHREVQVTEQELQPYQSWQTTKGFVVLLGVVVLMLVGSWPREVVALGAAGILLLSRKLTSRHTLQQIDWHLLVLFAGLFVVNHAMQKSGNLALGMNALKVWGVDPTQPTHLFATTVVLSNLVSNVPATMLLLPSATHSLAGPILALVSTMAGNLLIVGSIANIIVVDQAARMGLTISWRDHARVGVPITLGTLIITAAWLWAWSLW